MADFKYRLVIENESGDRKVVTENLNEYYPECDFCGACSTARQDADRLLDTVESKWVELMEGEIGSPLYEKE